MSKCWNCGVQIKDPVPVCPLCKCIVEPEEGEEAMQVYPHGFAEKGIKKMQRALSIYLFAAIVTEVILSGVTISLQGKPGTVIMVGAFLIYGFITLKVSIQMHTGYQLKMILQTFLGVGVVFVIDLETGFLGWSLNYVLPAAFMLLDLSIIILMLVNNRNWQSYIPMQLLLIALSIIGLALLYHFHIITHFLVPGLAMLFAVFTFVGTVILGGKRARDELYRRFHV